MWAKALLFVSNRELSYFDMFIAYISTLVSLSFRKDDRREDTQIAYNCIQFSGYLSWWGECRGTNGGWDGFIWFLWGDGGWYKWLYVQFMKSEEHYCSWGHKDRILSWYSSWTPNHTNKTHPRVWTA